MKIKRSASIPLLAIVLVLAIVIPTARGAVGVESVSRRGGPAGAEVRVTLGCGFCFPPCKGKPGHRNGPCMLGTKAQPPRAFPLSLVPVGRAPEPHPCGPRSVCSPEAAAPPARGPYRYLGEAVAEPRQGSEPPRYSLEFQIPDLPPGRYAYVIFCGVCNRGSGGSLIAVPRSPLWTLRIR